ncbi:MAG: PRD domain-containing protein [Spirochaetales bacterium]|nr:PRD domain-containing protein [Spirochaetales bacterium]
MRIRKVLNNNAVVALNDNLKEVVVIGKGLGFQRHVDDVVDPEKIEKIFTLTDKDSLNKFQSILSEIPITHILLTEKIIDYAVKEYKKELNDVIYVSLSDHINMAIERYRKGIVLKNPLVSDIKRFYRDEFEIGKWAVEILREETGLDFLIDEAAFIAFHFVNATSNIDMSNIMTMTRMIEEITSIVKSDFNIQLNEDSVGYLRFVNNLKLFAQRVINKNESYNMDNSEDDLYLIVKEKYPEAYRCTEKIAEWVEDKYNFIIGTDERLYLIIGIERMVNNERLKKSDT